MNRARLALDVCSGSGKVAAAAWAHEKRAASHCSDACTQTLPGTHTCSGNFKLLSVFMVSPTNLIALLQVKFRLYNNEGKVLLPADAELANSSATDWRGCFFGESVVMEGKVTAVVDGVASPEECCRKCRAAQVEASASSGGGGGEASVCNVWNYCDRDQCRCACVDASSCLAAWHPPCAVLAYAALQSKGATCIAAMAVLRVGWLHYCCAECLVPLVAHPICAPLVPAPAASKAMLAAASPSA